MHVGSVESASVRISVVAKIGVEMGFELSAFLDKKRDSGSSDSDFMATTPILLESNESEVSCLRRNVSYL